MGGKFPKFFQVQWFLETLISNFPHPKKTKKRLKSWKGNPENSQGVFWGPRRPQSSHLASALRSGASHCLRCGRGGWTGRSPVGEVQIAGIGEVEQRGVPRVPKGPQAFGKYGEIWSKLWSPELICLQSLVTMYGAWTTQFHKTCVLCRILKLCRWRSNWSERRGLHVLPQKCTLQYCTLRLIDGSGLVCSSVFIVLYWSIYTGLDT